MMGSGKTTLGERLAARLGRPFLDSDRLVHGRTDRTVGAILAEDGVATLRAAEEQALRDALASPGAAVVALAAGTILDPGTRSLIRDGGTVVWLRARGDTLAARIGGQAEPPHHAEDQAAWLRAEADARAPLFEGVADVIVDVDDADPDTLVATIAQALAEHGAAERPRPCRATSRASCLTWTACSWTPRSSGSRPSASSSSATGRTSRTDDHREVLGTSEDFTARTFARRLGLPTRRSRHSAPSTWIRSASASMRAWPRASGRPSSSPPCVAACHSGWLPTHAGSWLT